MIIRKSNKIPVRQDGAETPPALGVENSSAGSSAPAAIPPGSGRKLHQRARHDRLIAPEAQNHGLHDFADQSGTVVLIGVARHGLGTIVRPFKFFRPFNHHQPDSQMEAGNNARRY